jgi:hypothetical protein
MKIVKSAFIASACLLSLNAMAISEESLKKFSKFDKNSEFIIQYRDVDLILDAAVLYVGKSSRRKASKAKKAIGTRLKNNKKRLTSLEGNRFFYKEFKTPEQKALIERVRRSLESLPAESPLELFSKNEQLAYWLNLYNITLLEELIEIYPQRSLESEIDDGEFFAKKILTVAGEKLSLSDIKQIVIHNFGYDPLLIYGFHQGNIAGPDIRKFAYTGRNVWNTLDQNADFFINSNRGTYSKNSSTFKVSYLYEQNKAFFEKSDNDLRTHLSKYLARSYNDKLLAAKNITPNITNWAFADLFGSTRVYGGSASTSAAALMGAFVATQREFAPTGASGGFTDSGSFDSQLNDISPFQRLSALHHSDLVEILKVREVRQGSVTVTDMEETENSDEKEDKKSNEK